MTSFFGGHIALTEVWARGVLKSMEWSERKGTTGKIESSKQFLLKEKLTFPKHIALIIEEHDIPKDLILNLDLTTRPYVPLGNILLIQKVQRQCLLKVQMIKDKSLHPSQSTKPPIQLIYEGKTPRCLPRFVFPADFNVTFSDNHWSNMELN